MVDASCGTTQPDEDPGSEAAHVQRQRIQEVSEQCKDAKLQTPGLIELDAKLWRWQARYDLWERSQTAATCISKHARGMIARCYKRRHIAATTTIQAGVRGMITRSILRRRRFAALKLQYAWKRYLKRVAAATAIQAGARGRQGRLVVRRRRYSVWLVQTGGRRFVARRHRAATTIQAACRGRKARLMVRWQRYMLRLLQRWWRKMLRRQWGATRLQTAWRGKLARDELARRITAHRRWQASLNLQRYARKWKKARDLRKQREFEAMQRAALLIQSYMRCVLARLEMERRRLAIEKLQAAIRGKLARLEADRRRVRLVCCDIDRILERTCNLRWSSVLETP